MSIIEKLWAILALLSAVDPQSIGLPVVFKDPQETKVSVGAVSKVTVLAGQFVISTATKDSIKVMVGGGYSSAAFVVGPISRINLLTDESNSLIQVITDTFQVVNFYFWKNKTISLVKLQKFTGSSVDSCTRDSNKSVIHVVGKNASGIVISRYDHSFQSLTSKLSIPLSSITFSSLHVYSTNYLIPNGDSRFLAIFDATTYNMISNYSRSFNSQTSTLDNLKGLSLFDYSTDLKFLRVYDMNRSVLSNKLVFLRSLTLYSGVNTIVNMGTFQYVSLATSTYLALVNKWNYSISYSHMRPSEPLLNYSCTSLAIERSDRVYLGLITASYSLVEYFVQFNKCVETNTSTKECVKCMSGYKLSAEKVCVRILPIEDSCCSASCQTCNLSTCECLECRSSEDVYLHSGRCIKQEELAGAYGKVVGINRLQGCLDSRCLLCVEDRNICTLCLGESSSDLSPNGTCIPRLLGATGGYTRSCSTPNCLVCFVPEVCDVCKTNYYLHDQKCYMQQNLPDGFGLNLTTGEVKPCQVSNCTRCVSDCSKCDVCKPSFSLLNETHCQFNSTSVPTYPEIFRSPNTTDNSTNSTNNGSTADNASHPIKVEDYWYDELDGVLYMRCNSTVDISTTTIETIEQGSSKVYQLFRDEFRIVDDGSMLMISLRLKQTCFYGTLIVKLSKSSNFVVSKVAYTSGKQLALIRKAWVIISTTIRFFGAATGVAFSQILPIQATLIDSLLSNLATIRLALGSASPVQKLLLADLVSFKSMVVAVRISDGPSQVLRPRCRKPNLRNAKQACSLFEDLPANSYLSLVVFGLLCLVKLSKWLLSLQFTAKKQQVCASPANSAAKPDNKASSFISNFSLAAWLMQRADACQSELLAAWLGAFLSSEKSALGIAGLVVGALAASFYLVRLVLLTLWGVQARPGHLGERLLRWSGNDPALEKSRGALLGKLLLPSICGFLTAGFGVWPSSLSLAITWAFFSFALLKQQTVGLNGLLLTAYLSLSTAVSYLDSFSMIYEYMLLALLYALFVSCIVTLLVAICSFRGKKRRPTVLLAKDALNLLAVKPKRSPNQREVNQPPLKIIQTTKKSLQPKLLISKNSLEWQIRVDQKEIDAIFSPDLEDDRVLHKVPSLERLIGFSKVIRHLSTNQSHDLASAGALELNVLKKRKLQSTIIQRKFSFSQ